MRFAHGFKSVDDMNVCSVNQKEVKELEENKQICDVHDMVEAVRDKSKRVDFSKIVFRNRYVGVCIIVFVLIVGCVYGLRGYTQYIYSCYIDNEVSYKETISRLNVLGRFLDTKWMREKCAELENSRETYKNGCDYYEKLEWKKAMGCFEKVILEDINYNDAQKKLEKCKSNYYYPNTDIPTYTSVTGFQSNAQNHKITDTMVAYTYNYGDEGSINKYLEYLKKNCGYTFKGEIIEGQPFLEGFYGGDVKVILTGTRNQLIIGVTIK